jgi:hypothetical protein
VAPPGPQCHHAEAYVQVKFQIPQLFSMLLNSLVIIETMRRCGFFFDVFGLELPEYLTCNLFAESQNPDECVGAKEVREAQKRAQKPGKPSIVVNLFK